MELRVVATGPNTFYVEEHVNRVLFGPTWTRLREYHGCWGGGMFIDAMYTSEAAAVKAAKEYAERSCRIEAEIKKKEDFANSYKPVYITHDCS